MYTVYVQQPSADVQTQPSVSIRRLLHNYNCAQFHMYRVKLLIFPGIIVIRFSRFFLVISY